MGVGLLRDRLCVRDLELLAVVTDDSCDDGAVGSRRRGEDVVPDLVVWPAIEGGEQRVAPGVRAMTLRLVNTWREKKSMRDSLRVIGMRLWLGTNEAPRYTLKTAICAPKEAAALLTGRKMKPDSEVDRQEKGDRDDFPGAAFHTLPGDQVHHGAHMQVDTLGGQQGEEKIALGFGDQPQDPLLLGVLGLERNGFSFDVRVFADVVGHDVVLAVLIHPPLVADADHDGSQKPAEGVVGGSRGEGLPVCGLVRQERELGQNNAEGRGDQQLEPALSQEDLAAHIF